MVIGNRRLEQHVEKLTEQVQALATTVAEVSSRVASIDSSIGKEFSETRGLLDASHRETRSLLSAARDSLHEDIYAVRQDLAPRIEVVRAEISRLHGPRPPAEDSPVTETEAEAGREVPPAEPAETEATGEQGPLDEPTAGGDPSSQSAAPAAESAPADQTAGKEGRQAKEYTDGGESQTGADRCLPGHAEFEAHCESLRAAASVTSVWLNCHRDLWAFLVDKAAHVAHFRIPGEAVAHSGGRVRVPLSGPSLIAVLTALWELRCLERTPCERLGDWAQASVLYDSVAAALADLERGARGKGDDLDIYIDLRGKRRAEDDEGRTRDEREGESASDTNEDNPDGDEGEKIGGSVTDDRSGESEEAGESGAGGRAREGGDEEEKPAADD